MIYLVQLATFRNTFGEKEGTEILGLGTFSPSTEIFSVYSDVVSGLWQLLSKPAALASPEGIITHVNSQAHSLMVERHWLCQVFSHLFSRGALKIASKEDRASMSIFILQME